jgi:hypothetical protein
MEHRRESFKPSANDPGALREEPRPSVPNGVNDQEQKYRRHRRLDRFEKVNLDKKNS